MCMPQISFVWAHSSCKSAGGRSSRCFNRMRIWSPSRFAVNEQQLYKQLAIPVRQSQICIQKFALIPGCGLMSCSTDVKQTFSVCAAKKHRRLMQKCWTVPDQTAIASVFWKKYGRNVHVSQASDRGRRAKCACAVGLS